MINIELEKARKPEGIDKELLDVKKLLEQRLKEAKRLGMNQALIPGNGKLPESIQGVEIVKVSTIADAVKWVMDRK